MRHLCCVWLNVNDVVDKLGGRVKQPTVSHHLKLLEDAGLVFAQQVGRHRYYSLNQEHLTTCCNTLISKFAPDYGEAVIDVDSIPVVEHQLVVDD